MEDNLLDNITKKRDEAEVIAGLRAELAMAKKDVEMALELSRINRDIGKSLDIKLTTLNEENDRLHDKDTNQQIAIATLDELLTASTALTKSRGETLESMRPHLKSLSQAYMGYAKESHHHGNTDTVKFWETKAKELAVFMAINLPAEQGCKVCKGTGKEKSTSDMGVTLYSCVKPCPVCQDDKGAK